MQNGHLKTQYTNYPRLSSHSPNLAHRVTPYENYQAPKSQPTQHLQNFNPHFTLTKDLQPTPRSNQQHNPSSSKRKKKQKTPKIISFCPFPEPPHQQNHPNTTKTEKFHNKQNILKKANKYPTTQSSLPIKAKIFFPFSLFPILSSPQNLPITFLPSTKKGNPSSPIQDRQHQVWERTRKKKF